MPILNALDITTVILPLLVVTMISEMVEKPKKKGSEHKKPRQGHPLEGVEDYYTYGGREAH